MEDNEGVCLTKWRIGHGPWSNENIEGDHCQGLYDHFVRRIMKDDSWDAIASGQPLKDLHLTCKKSAQRLLQQYSVLQMPAIYLLVSHVCIDNLPQVKNLILTPERQDDRSLADTPWDAQEPSVVFSMRRVCHNCLSPPATGVT